ncbi:zinc ribbon domain-containing protein [Nocardioides sp. Y6]|uniref:Zinc ribbon domain-containing protein n=1 Tax=Nocardioides malaquae TaxID=2773426 RepID=A0ABR9RRE1_9ACTN|nr:zinc ribbon domain-containing protein [Nocardioides malaquae]MBE7324126.1 zinc ribbon domain-containing protein [Nocardioides malaquae]
MDRPDSTPTVAPAGFDCPECGEQLAVGVPACPRCGIRLVGPLAQQLWRVDQQIAQLSAESRRLRELLRQPPTAAELSPVVPSTVTPGVRPPHAPPGLAPQPVGPTPHRGLTGQQLLLGLAALLLLSGVAFFLLVVWSLIGLLGQAVVMVVLTVAAAGGAVLATRKRLPAAAETAAVIASGLVLLDLTAAHRLGLAGLDRLDASSYWAGAGLLGAVVLLAFDRWVPRSDAHGTLRRIVSYRPVAVALATTALWAGAIAVAPGDLGDVSSSALALVLGLLSLGLVALGVRLDGSPRLFSVSSAVPWLSAGYALLVHLGVALDVGFSNASTGDRVLATVLLLAGPLVLLLAQTRPFLADQPGLRVGLRLVGLAGVALALGVPVFATPRLGVALVALGLGLLLGGLALIGHDGATDRGWAELTWGDLATWVLRLAIAALFFLLFLLLGGGHASGVDMQALRGGAGPGQWWLPLLPAVALVAPSAVTVVRRRSVSVALLAHTAALVGVLMALRDAETITWAVVGLAGAVLCAALAAAARWSHDGAHGLGLEVAALVAAAVYAVVTVAAGFGESDFVLSAVLVGLGAVLVAYAALPGRLGFAEVGVFALALAWWVQLADREIEVVEWWTLPVAAMLAGIGAVRWRRDRGSRTWVTMAPGLTVALYPSLLVALSEDSLVRLVAVTAVAALVLVVGIANRWQAPVLLGALALAFVAWTQGGPLIAYVPGWILLTGSGLVLLVIGIMWERSIQTGRRTVAWLGAMQ